MTVKRLQNTWVVSEDVAASRDFYENLLGLRPKFADGDRWVQYGVGGVNFAIGAILENPAGRDAQSRGAVPVFEVGDLEGYSKQLSEAGITVLGQRDMGSHGRVLTVLDPAGNLVQLFEQTEKTALRPAPE